MSNAEVFLLFAMVPAWVYCLGGGWLLLAMGFEGDVDSGFNTACRVVGLILAVLGGLVGCIKLVMWML